MTRGHLSARQRNDKRQSTPTQSRFVRREELERVCNDLQNKIADLRQEENTLKQRLAPA